MGIPAKSDPSPHNLSDRRRVAQRALAKAGDRVTPRVRKAVHDMVWHGLTWDQAADAHTINRGAFARSLSRPGVQALIRAEVQVLKSSASPMAARRIIDLAGQDENLKVALEAAKYIDSGGKSDGPTVNVNVGVSLQPGYQVRIPEGMIDVTPGHQPSGLLTQTANPLIPQADVPTPEKGTP